MTEKQKNFLEEKFNGPHVELTPNVLFTARDSMGNLIFVEFLKDRAIVYTEHDRYHIE